MNFKINPFKLFTRFELWLWGISLVTVFLSFIIPEEKDVLSLGATEQEIARNVYYLLHEAEEKCDLLIAIAMEEEGALVGVMNRLKKACAP